MSYQRSSHHPEVYEPSSNRFSSDMQPSSYGAVVDNSDQESDNFGYIEFSGKGGRTCPTCNGTGRIAKHQEDELVALIPYNDRRLKPSRTKTYVGIAVILSLLVCGLIVFFLFPRSVTFDHGKIVNFKVYPNKNTTSTTIKLLTQFNITNNNFFQVELAEFSVDAFVSQVAVGSNKLPHTPVPLGPKLSNYSANVTIVMNFDDKNNMNYIYDLCTNPKRKVHNFVVELQATQTVKYMQHSEQSSRTEYKYIDCFVNHTDLSDNNS